MEVKKIIQNKISPNLIKRINTILSIFCVFFVLGLIVHDGYEIPKNSAQDFIYKFLAFSTVILFCIDVFINYFKKLSHLDFLKKNYFDIFIIIILLLTLLHIYYAPIAILLRQVLNALRSTPIKPSAVERLNLSPPQILGLSFLIVILLGTMFLTFPGATTTSGSCPFLTALYTSTSATCVTGLIVEDTPDYFTLFGQIVILCLIQVGGLGIMTISAFLIMMLGQRFGMRRQSEITTILDNPSNIGLSNILYFILKTTFIIEGIGILLLFPSFRREFGNWVEALYYSIFHSVSAFCNAGFVLFTDNFMGFKNDIIINITIILLIIAGGLGFIVMWNLRDFYHSKHPVRQRWLSLNIHTKIVLVLSFILICSGTIIIFFFEFENENTMFDMSVPAKLLAAFFQSVTLRTAGFNTIDISGMKHATLFLMCLFMFIGASPGSTGGGIKTSTFAILLLAIKSTLQNRADIEVYQRIIPRVLVYRAVTIMVISAAVVCIYTSVLSVTQTARFLPVLFETVSAFGTVGLSTGITPTFNSLGKFLIITLMFIGRVGPLTMAFALAKHQVPSMITYPTVRIMVG